MVKANIKAIYHQDEALFWRLLAFATDSLAANIKVTLALDRGLVKRIQVMLHHDRALQTTLHRVLSGAEFRCIRNRILATPRCFRCSNRESSRGHIFRNV